MSDMQIFENLEFGRIRGVEIDGEPWLVGKDVAQALGYANPSKAIIDHVDDEDKRFEMFDIADSQNGNLPIGQTKTALINESGFYALVFSSKLPSAKAFKHWVTSEVLPSIRKNGYYVHNKQESDELTFKKLFEKDHRMSIDFLGTQYYNICVHKKEVMKCRPVPAGQKLIIRRTFNSK